MNYESKQIRIAPFNVKLYYDANIEQSLQPFVNKIIEKYFAGKLVEINNGNCKQVNEIAEKLKCTTEEAVNHVFGCYHFITDETPKERITLPKKVSKIKTKKINIITDF